MADDFERLCEAVSAVPCSDGDVLGDWLAYASPGDDDALLRAAVLAALREMERIAIEQGRLGRDFLSDLIAQAEGGQK